jgi:abhydrolase domain-containing protein 17
LFLPCEDGGNKVVIYFHGNAEDIGLAFDLLYMFGSEMQMHVIAVEYPGYGLYKTSKPNEQMMKEDADAIYDYLTAIVGVKESDIILMGRSMGSGPTSYLASRKEAHSLLLMSPYMSIKDAAKSLFGWASFLSVIVYERFRNIDLIAKAKCPVFFLHGQKDTLIPHSHSVELNRVCPRESYLHLPVDMDHNEFQLLEDLVEPFKSFIS